jgi:hypothetical protein
MTTTACYLQNNDAKYSNRNNVEVLSSLGKDKETALFKKNLFKKSFE